MKSKSKKVNYAQLSNDDLVKLAQGEGKKSLRAQNELVKRAVTTY